MARKSFFEQLCKAFRKALSSYASNKSSRRKSSAAWHSDPATEAQLSYLQSLGGKIPSRGLTKLEAHERISKLEPIDEDDAEVLRYFKVSCRNATKAQAAEAVKILMADAQHKAAWDERPPSAITKEFFRFFGEKMPAGIGYAKAEVVRKAREKEMHAAGDPKFEDWCHYWTVLQELMDTDAREMWDIKKPSVSLVRQCVAELRAEGVSYKDMADDQDDLVERMIQKKPDLEK